MKYSYDRAFRLKINDDRWEFYLITEEEADELDEDTGFKAMTQTEEKCMFFVEGSTTKNIITHELFHLYVSYFHLDSANINLEMFEEIVAEFLEMNLEKFIRVRNKIYNKFKKLEEMGRKK
jgi:hypothetical protein